MVTGRGTRFLLCPILTKFNYIFRVGIVVSEEILKILQIIRDVALLRLFFWFMKLFD